jgi:hypothetical protein
MAAVYPAGPDPMIKHLTDSIVSDMVGDFRTKINVLIKLIDLSY